MDMGTWHNTPRIVNRSRRPVRFYRRHAGAVLDRDGVVGVDGYYVEEEIAGTCVDYQRFMYASMPADRGKRATVPSCCGISIISSSAAFSARFMRSLSPLAAPSLSLL